MENATASTYHCEQCCYSFSIYSYTKELEAISAPMERHEMEDK
jgi:hypothetical protein